MTRLRLLLAGSVVLALQVPSYAQKIYFTDGTPHTIRRANLDGSNVENAVDTSPYEAYAIALDPTRNLVYWTVDGGFIYRAGMDGSGVQRVLTTASPWGVAVDSLNAKLYWTFGFDFPVGIRRANLDGSAVETLYEAMNNIAPERIAIGSPTGTLYWTEPFSYAVFRSDRDGHGVQQIVVSPSPLKPFGIAVDMIHGKLFWTLNQVNGFSVPGKVQRANFDGTQIEELGTVEPGYAEVAVDPYRAKVYWTDRFVIRRADLDGTHVETILSTTLDWVGPIALDPGIRIPALSFTGVLALGLALLIAGLWMLTRSRTGDPLGSRSIPILLGMLAFFPGVSAAWEGGPDLPVLIEERDVDSGIVGSPIAGTEPVAVVDIVVPGIQGALWTRLHFTSVLLSDPPGPGNASFLRLTSLPPSGDGAQQRLDAASLSEWSNTSAYFTGESVRVELLAYPGTGDNRVGVDRVAGPAGFVCNPAPGGFCAGTDDRTPSTNVRTARFRYPKSCSSQNDSENFCTAFLVSNGSNWFLTAGHCCSLANFECLFIPIVEFGVPQSGSTGALLPPPPERQFPAPVGLSGSWFQSENPNPNDGLDWCFFGVHKNSNTRLTPVQTFGGSYRLATTLDAVAGASMRVTGFGVDNDPFTECATNREAAGAYVGLDGTIVKFAVDAQPGNSGSPVESICGSVYAIFTDGRCGDLGYNLGTAITYYPLQDALTPNTVDAGFLEPLGAAADCNGNGINDWCDVSCQPARCNVPGCGTSGNCNNNLIPDDCESYADCNANGVRDICELGTSTAPDCNGNAVPDSCDLVTQFSRDCNCNGLPDECDICALPSLDGNNNWAVDECEGQPQGAVADPGGILKNRFLTFSNPDNSGSTAIQVTMVDLQNPNPSNPPQSQPQDFSGYEAATCSAASGEAVPSNAIGEGGCARWVGPVWTFQEKQDVLSLGTYRASRLQCTPYYHLWSTEGDFHVTGAEIMPSSSYDVQVFAGICEGSESTCVNVSCPLGVTTARWGDVAYPWSPPATTDQPDGSDAVAVMNKFKGLSGSPSNTGALLQPNVLNLNGDVGGSDIVATVDAFKGLAYGFSGPCPCPSPVPCETQSCGPITDCSRLCVGGSKNGQGCDLNCDCCLDEYTDCLGRSPPSCTGASPPVCAATNGICIKTCIGGPNAGRPCTEARDCNYCSGGTSAFVPCNPNLQSPCSDGPCGVRICSVGKIGTTCAGDDDCDTEQGSCYNGACRDAQGSVCNSCSIPLESCHCDGFCGGVSVGECGTGYCRDRCGRCN